MASTETLSASLGERQRIGLLGRGIRLGLSMLTLSFFAGLIGPWREPLFTGTVPSSWTFLAAFGFTVYVTNDVVNLLFMREWGQRPLIIATGAMIAATAADGFVAPNDPSPLAGLTAFVWLAGITLLLGSAHLLAAVLATPGCEMRSFAQLLAKFTGQDVEVAACPKGIDRFDDVGSSRVGGHTDAR